MSLVKPSNHPDCGRELRANLTDAVRRPPIRVLFVPGNPLHAKTHLLVAEELTRRGHVATFLARDQVTTADYRVREVLENSGYEIIDYAHFYESDQGRVFPSLQTYGRSRRAVFDFLSRLPFDLSVSCNDTSALFDRLVVAFGRRHNKPSLLIQESIKQARREITLRAVMRRHGIRKATLLAARRAAVRWLPGPFTARPYGHSECTLIACAGERFRQQLLAEGVAATKLHVTGQPRFENQKPRTTEDRSIRLSSDAVLLYCSQPLQGCAEAARQFFVDLVRACDSMPGVRLIVKLHPRDDHPDALQKLLPDSAGSSLLEITRQRSLSECFAMSQAMITVTSTTCVEAMQAELPVGLLNYFPTNRYLPYDQYEAVVPINSPANLRESLHRLLFDPELRRCLVANSPKVIEDEMFKLDGRSAERIVDLIEEQVDARQVR